jgi:hypothetical protein
LAVGASGVPSCSRMTPAREVGILDRERTRRVKAYQALKA